MAALYIVLLHRTLVIAELIYHSHLPHHSRYLVKLKTSFVWLLFNWRIIHRICIIKSCFCSLCLEDKPEGWSLYRYHILNYLVWLSIDQTSVEKLEKWAIWGNRILFASKAKINLFLNFFSNRVVLKLFEDWSKNF